MPFPTPRNVFLPVESSTFEFVEPTPETSETEIARERERVVRLIEDDALAAFDRGRRAAARD